MNLRGHGNTGAKGMFASLVILAVCVAMALRLPRYMAGEVRIAIAAGAVALFLGFLLYGFFKGRKKQAARKQNHTLKVIKGGMAHIPKPKKRDVDRASGKIKKHGGGK